MTRLLPLTFLLGLFLSANAQQDFFGPYELADTSELFTYLDTLEAQSTRAVDSTYRSYVADYLGTRTEIIKGAVLDSSLVFAPEVMASVDQVLQRIIEANELDVSPRAFIARNPKINAASLGDGLFLVNVGLLKSVTSERGLAFVLSHELAHDQLDHAGASMLSRATRAKEYDEEVEAWNELSRRKRRRQIRSMRRNGERMGPSMTEIRDLIYANKRHSRANEVAADSLGMQYLLAAGYDRTAGFDALGNFYSERLVLPVGTAAKLLTTTDHPFDPAWTEAPTTMFGGSFGGASEAGFWRHDSLRTHPDLGLRIELLALAVDSTKVPSPHGHTQWAQREILNSYLYEHQPAHALVMAMRGLVDEGADEAPDFYYAMAARSLLEVVRAIDERYFDKAIPPSKYFPDPGVSEVTLFLQNATRNDFWQLANGIITEQLIHHPTSAHLLSAQEELTSYK